MEKNWKKRWMAGAMAFALCCTCLLYTSVTHKNCKGMEDFTENIESIFDYYREVLKGVMRLCDIWIEHPANAMAGIMKQAGFGKKLLAETVEQFKATTGNEPCSA